MHRHCAICLTQTCDQVGSCLFSRFWSLLWTASLEPIHLLVITRTVCSATTGLANVPFSASNGVFTLKFANFQLLQSSEWSAFACADHCPLMDSGIDCQLLSPNLLLFWSLLLLLSADGHLSYGNSFAWTNSRKSNQLSIESSKCRPVARFPAHRPLALVPCGPLV